MIIDTDVLIWHLRGNEKAKEFIRNSFPFNISVVTYIEIIHGMRDKKEMHRLLKQFAKWHVNIVQITGIFQPLKSKNSFRFDIMKTAL